MPCACSENKRAGDCKRPDCWLAFVLDDRRNLTGYTCSVTGSVVSDAGKRPRGPKCLVIFASVWMIAGLNLVFVRELTPGPATFGRLSQVVIGLLAAIIAANIIAVFFEEGFHLFLPDNPTRYELLYDLGIR